MLDVRLLDLLERQWNRVSLAQLEALGFSRVDVQYRVMTGRLRAVHQGVFAARPLLDDQRGQWMAATLTAPGTCLSHASSAALHGFWDRRRAVETVTRPGNGGPRHIDDLFVYRSVTLAGNRRPSTASPPRHRSGPSSRWRRTSTSVAWGGR
jgi:hypothetical protein